MRILYTLIILFFLTGHSKVASAEDGQIPRTIIALYDGKSSDFIESNIHTLVEMPLNHLGLKVEYCDIHKPLPDIAKRQDVRGVLTWLFFDTKMDNPVAYLKWALNVANSGKKYVILGTLGAMGGKKKPSLTLVNSFMSKIGMKMTNGWTETAFDVAYFYNSPEMFLTKEPFAWNRPSYETVTVIDSTSTIHLSAKKGNNSEENSDLIVTGPNGGYASSGYIAKTDVVAGRNSRQWIIDPFRFFRLAFATDNLPKPDTTTIAGRRIYYSHIDGDGFNSITRLEEYRDKKVLSAQVIMDKAVKPYPDLPVTLTAIAADIDPAWVATETSRDIAKEFFALPQVEAGSHTYSHPFNWRFFEDGNIKKEIPYLKLYPQNDKQPVWTPENAQKAPNFFTALFSDKLLAKPMPSGYAVPRAYAQQPFDINKEVQGSIDEISTLLPKNKKVKIIMWSGDCTPWAEALRISRAAGIQNINGGDTVFDTRHPSYATVAPIGRQVGNEQQIYASTSNEIPYTNEWTENFDAYRHLLETLENTESPTRLKPLNIYYHLYSGEREAGLNALLANLEYARKQNITPITTSHYTHIAEGFYSTKFIPLASNMWRIEKSGELGTIRFDQHTFKSIDFGRSKGVIGQRHLQGSLYVYLDTNVANPIIALKNNLNYFLPPEENLPYLIESRWLISDLTRSSNKFEFKAQGFGNGDMLWQIPVDGKYLIRINGKSQGIITSIGRSLKLELKQRATQPLHLTITRV